jgi:hypothetical protein
MHQHTSDPNLYYIGTDSDKLILVVYVDDLFITRSDETKISWLKQKFNKEFDMTDWDLSNNTLELNSSGFQPECFSHSINTSSTC